MRLDRVLVGAIKQLDSYVLLDPFEKQLDMPSLEKQFLIYSSWKAKLFVKKCDVHASVALDDDMSSRSGVVLADIEVCQHYRLIAHDARVSRSTGLNESA